MGAFTILPLTLLLFVPIAVAQDDLVPPGHPPGLWRASAAETDGKVVIQIARPSVVLPPKSSVVDKMKWENLKTVTLGDTLQAYGVDGKPLDSAAVLKALAKPTGVAVFVRIYSCDPYQPPPFYLAMLREGTIVLVVIGEDVYELPP